MGAQTGVAAFRGIVLVGMMFSGKTGVAGELSRLLRMRVLDTDEAVAAAAGASVDELWAGEGEAGFRRREAAVVKALSAGELASKHPVIVSTGGGIVTSPGIDGAFRAVGPVVYLRAKPATLARRAVASSQASAGASGRPLIADVLESGEVALTARFEGILRERGAAYEAIADLVVDVDDLSPAETADAIAAAGFAIGGTDDA